MDTPRRPTPPTRSRLRALGWMLLAGLWAWLGVLAASLAQVPGGARTAVVLTIDGAIGPASADYVKRGLARAQERGAAAVVLQIDTPGGLDTSMREIIRAILASPLPVLSHVAPSGARAASAGTYILYASHVAAMAPGTNLGAATPVQIGGGSPLPGGPSDERPAPPPAPAASAASAPAGGDGVTRSPRRGSSAMDAKVTNDAVAYIRSLAELHGRNADWAEAAVRDAASLAAEDALKRGVIDLIAASVADLLDKAHGREVRLGEARVTLDTKGLAIERLDPDWRSRLLGAITNPNLALILMLVGIYGLIFEFMNPGALVPGTIGAISLLLGLYALSALPVNYVGVALLLLGIALMVAEAFTPSVGVLGIGGVVAFVFGAMLLFDADAPGFGVSLPLVAGIALASLGMTLLIVRLALKSRRSRVVTGAEGMVGTEGRVLDWDGRAGHVLAAGERWAADGPEGLRPGQVVTVTAVHGLQLSVQPAREAWPVPHHP
ncbi:NfeD family protein [Azohydromonas sediminis]|uniref:NfeD family protein n=1 Tax=Azohydromonas sediminis TaxID=2259674 RepID=UPI000E6490C4|nr:nodulation protein NfeD [Azohydromonas sediminis]